MHDDNEVEVELEPVDSIEVDEMTMPQRAARIEERLSPSSYAIHRKILASLGDPDIERVVDLGRRTLVHVVARECDDDLIQTTLVSAVKIIRLEHGLKCNGVEFLQMETGRSKRSVKRTVDVGTLARAFADFSIVVVVSATAENFELRALADVTIDLSTITTEDVLAALRRRFPDDSSEAREWSWPADLPLTALDFVCSKGSGLNDALTMLSMLSAPDAPPLPPPPDEDGLEDVHGMDAARDWGLSVVKDVAAFREGRIRWQDVDAGVLLVGPPGTGKTTFAAILARSAGMTLVSTSYAAWQSAGDGHLGTILKTMNESFATAVSSAPAILFIDEIDTLPTRGIGRYTDWWTAITNGLLEQLDGASRREGVVVVAACNHADGLDPALVRSGRLDRTIRIDLPDGDALSRILHSKVQGVVPLEDIRPLATMLAVTMSGADAARVVRDARRFARSEDRPVQLRDLEAAALPKDWRSDHDRQRIAVHEAAHAVAGMTYGTVPVSVSILAGPGTGGGTVFERVQAASLLVEDVEMLAVRALSGRAAEECLLGSISGGAGGSVMSDLAITTALILEAEARLGLGSSLVYDLAPDRRGVETIIQRFYAQAQLLVSRHREAIMDLAEILMKDRVLGSLQLTAFAKKHGFDVGRPDEG